MLAADKQYKKGELTNVRLLNEESVYRRAEREEENLNLP